MPAPKPTGPNLDPQIDANPFPSTYKPLPSVPTAFVGATIFTGTGQKIDNGTVLLRDGKIEAVGANISVPADFKSVDAKGNMTFEYRILSVDLAQRVGDKDEIKFSSETDATAPAVFKKVAETVNKPLGLITINPRGQVTNRDNDTKNPQLGMGELTIPLPEEAIAVGSEWSVPREMRVKLEDGSQKTIKVRELYTLEKVSAGVATIRIESQPLTPVNDPAVESQLIQQLSKGQIKFDIDRGRMLSKQLDWSEEAIGFRGDNTSLKYDARFTEELLSTAPKTAANRSTKIVE